MRIAVGLIYLPICALGVTLSVGFFTVSALADDRSDFESLERQMDVADQAGDFPTAEKAGRRLLLLVDRVAPKRKPYFLTQVGILSKQQQKYDEANRLLTEAVALYEGDPKADQVEWAEARSALAMIYSRQGKFVEAESLYQKAIAGVAAVLGSMHLETLGVTSNLAEMYHEQGRIDEAIALNQNLIKAEEKAIGKTAIELTVPLINLGRIYNNQGLYDKAEPLYRRALGIQLQTIGPKHPHTADTVHRLGSLYMMQLRYAEAEAFTRRAIAIREEIYGPNSSRLALGISNLALILNAQGRFADAHALLVRALELYSKAPETDPREIAKALADLGYIELSMDRNAEGEKTLRRSLAKYEQSPGFNDSMICHVSMKLAHAYERLERWAEAEACVERSRQIAEAGGESLLALYDIYYTQANIFWRAERREEALEVLRQALDIAEIQRQHSSGGEVDRATLFADCARGFDRMIGYQLELNDAAGAAQTIERFRARTLLDEMQMAGSDLLDGASAEARAATQQRYAQLQQQLAALSEKLHQLPVDESRDKPNPQRQELLNAVSAARERLYRHYRDVRSQSEVYRSFITRETKAPNLAEIQAKLAGEDCLVLSYFIGPINSYVVAIDGPSTKVFLLTTSPEIAKRLKIHPGPLYYTALQWLLVNANDDGVLQQLSKPATAGGAAPRLAAMWELLVPAELRERSLSGTINRLVVLPDGPLALLPFECLVVNPSSESPRRETEYLLDVGPAISYGPSAAVLLNLLARPRTERIGDQTSVLSVGDPAYSDVSATNSQQLNTQRPSPQSRLRSGFRRLPYSGTESRWVSEIFGKGGQSTKRLTGATATEANVRSQVTGKHILHLACHGLSDDEYGNLFGALALAPGPKSGDPADDGMLMLNEIYDIDLHGCELAILSACMTNYGPQQEGEGVWALSRGFLVAGARRVVASNWVVDDEAAATLISVFCSGVAKSQTEAKLPEYARSLQAAKRSVRKQAKWSSPYYWAPFVLIGPQ